MATDLGQVTGEVYDGVRGCDLALLEANYDPELLRMGRYPYFLKRRISGNDGHLANPSCAEFACGLLESGTTRLIPDIFRGRTTVPPSPNRRWMTL